jgi:ATP-dependent DNA helicase RecG
MQIMTQTNDGFVLAQKDLELRGTGDIFGVNQSGMPDFKVGDPINDLNMLQVAQNEASYLLSTPNWDSDEQNLPLVAYLKKRKLQTHFD